MLRRLMPDESTLVGWTSYSFLDELLKFFFDFLNTGEAGLMLHLMLPPYDRSLNTVLLVGGNQVGDFSTQLLNAFFEFM
jgi:hypothetical protein